MTERYLAARAVAEQLGVSCETVLRWVRRGELPAIRLPGGAIRIGQQELEEWLMHRATPRRGVSPAPTGAAQRVPYVLSPVPEDEE
jgi:excisionase family DNA binding protein